MTTATKTGECRKTRKKRINLICPCGKVLEISVCLCNWWESALEVARANEWRLCEEYSQHLGEALDATCPYCHK